MSRREIVLLVSRAIALLLAVPAAVSFALSIPAQMATLYLRQSLQHSVLLQAPVMDMIRLQGVTLGVTLAASLLSLLIHLGIAALFWRCGPWTERMLLPAGSQLKGAA